MYSQLFNLLCDKADDVYNGRLPVHVRCLLDEFANIGQIPKFDKLIATIRSREISASIILQSQSQLKTIYKDAADTIVGNCDCTLFLGGKEKSTLKELSEILGKETIDLYNTSETRSTNNSYGLNYQKTGKYSVIYADPPWRYKVYSKKGLGRSAESHYPTMSLEDIKALPIGELDYQLVRTVFLDVKDVALIVVGQHFVFWMLRNVVLVTEKRSHASKLQNTFAAVHDSDFVLRHELL